MKLLSELWVWWIEWKTRKGLNREKNDDLSHQSGQKQKVDLICWMLLG